MLPASGASREGESDHAASSQPAASPAADVHNASAADSTIRVDVGLLDKLMNLVGELVLARNQIVQFTSQPEEASLLGTSQRLNLITTELQESVMKTRMQPIGNVWSKFPAHRPRPGCRPAANRCASRWKARRPSWTRPSSRPSKIR